jgi:coenzyme F420 biosynthesis associated uncharacterized protein
MIDWKVALTTGTRLTRPGPDVSAEQAAEIVLELREAAKLAEAPVREFTGLSADPGSAPVQVVDRHRWLEANIETFRMIVTPVMDKLAETNKLALVAGSLGGKVAGAEVGALLSFLAPKVLGQYDPFATPGRLLLVAPNIVATERKLGVDETDFRQWVCLHEETHRVQFTAVDWLGGHIQGLIGEFTDDADFSADRLVSSLGELVKVLRGESDKSLSDLLQNDRQKALVAKMTGVMSLLEGHADVVMDGVGPEVIATVEQIRAKFEARRDGIGSLDRLVRRLLGLEAKMRQYRDGAKFVRAVVDTAGMEGFNAVWAEPANLPNMAEIADPGAWLKRVHQ